MIDRTTYDPYGNVIGRTNNDRAGYTGHVMDSATGLTYMQQRYYDPLLGRFLSTDPVQANANTGASFSRYSYANNNPYRFADPDGREAGCMYAPSMCGLKPLTPAQKEEERAVGRMFLTGAANTLGILEGVGAIRTLGQTIFSRFVVAQTAKQATREFSVNSAQLGRKLGKHVADFGGTAASAADRSATTKLIYEIGTSPDKAVSGLWRGLGEGGKIGAAEFRIKGTDVVVTTPEGEFVTLLKNGVENKFVRSALEAPK